mmetsp:Transcript_12581/g.42544  ORF Transcript_12581/g.42544 Transcript_12581/m.42544 type:complete len:334 (+) Transcript_12581:542-1543(+)
MRSPATVREIILRCVRAVCALDPSVIYWPEGDELIGVVNGFQELSHLPFCAGAVDGTHVEIPRPRNFAGDYVYYKGKFTRSIQATVDHRGLFRHVLCGYPGSVNDAHVIKLSGLRKILRSMCWRTNTYVIGDDAYALSPVLLVSYGKDTDDTKEEAFNHCLDRARVVVENAFGRLKNRFRRLRYVNVKHEHQPMYMLACCVLHNIIEMEEGAPAAEDAPELTRPMDARGPAERQFDPKHAPRYSRKEQWDMGFRGVVNMVDHAQCMALAASSTRRLPANPVAHSGYDPCEDRNAGLRLRRMLTRYIWPFALEERDSKDRAYEFLLGLGLVQPV